MKKISLTQGKFALVDDEDVLFLSQWKWSYSKSGYTTRQATYHGRSYCVYMHKVLLGYFGAHCGDHVNRDRLDNRKSNLRVATTLQNGRNKSVYKNSPNGYRGVRPKGGAGRYAARIKVGKKEFSLGSYSTIEEAARAYDIAAKKHFGEWACLNFP